MCLATELVTRLGDTATFHALLADMCEHIEQERATQQQVASSIGASTSRGHQHKRHRLGHFCPFTLTVSIAVLSRGCLPAHQCTPSHVVVCLHGEQVKKYAQARTVGERRNIVASVIYHPAHCSHALGPYNARHCFLNDFAELLTDDADVVLGPLELHTFSSHPARVALGTTPIKVGVSSKASSSGIRRASNAKEARDELSLKRLLERPPGEHPLVSQLVRYLADVKVVLC